MINWLHVLFNLLWILGLSLILAALSHTLWLAYQRGIRARPLLGTPTFQLPFTLGLALVALGLFFLGRGWLEHLVWAIFVLLFALQAWGVWREIR
jgi:hypothetical protein